MRLCHVIGRCKRTKHNSGHPKQAKHMVVSLILSLNDIGFKNKRNILGLRGIA